MNLLHLLLFLIAGMASSAHAAESGEYLYYRDATVPPFQKMHEFFDMPNRPGHYEITLVSDALGPLTFRIVRVHDEQETTLVQRRSYHIRNHELHATFNNPRGVDDLYVEIANSNPAVSATVSIYVVELP